MQTKYAENDQIKRLFYPHNPLSIASCYLHLALVQDKEIKIQQDKVSQVGTQRDYLLHEYERIDHIQKKLEVHEILRECKNANKRIFIEGAAGAGKSTLCQQIAFDWSQGNETWKHYKWMFHIRLRDLRSVKPNTKDYLAEVLQECFYYHDDELEDWKLEKIRKEIRVNKRSVMFLLDGYDELHLDTYTLRKLLESLKDYDFIVTSRPGSDFKVNIGKNHNVDIKQLLHLAVLGFNDLQIKQYVYQFFDSKYTPEAKLEEAKVCLQGLQNNPNLWSLAHIPIQLELLCSIWGDELKNQSTINLTSLYELILEKLLIRLEVERRNEGLGDIVPDYLKEYTYNQHLVYLSYLAYLGMKDEKIVLEQKKYIEKALKDLNIKEEPKIFFNTLRDLGLFKRSENGKLGEFIHLTFQEFLSAKHWVKLFSKKTTQKEAIQCFVVNRDNPQYQVMWWFVAGLLKQDIKLLELFFTNLLNEADQVLLQEQLFANPYRLLLSLRCVEESAQHNDFASLPQMNCFLELYNRYIETIIVSKIKSFLNYPLEEQFRNLLFNLKISPLLINKLNIDQLFSQEIKKGYKQQRLQLANIIIELGHKTLLAIQELVQVLKGSENPNTVAQLLLWLDQDKQTAIELLLGNLKTRHAHERHWSAIQLIELGEKKEEALAVFVKDLSADDAYVRQWAAEKLIRLGEMKEEAVSVLVKNLSAKKAEVRNLAARRLFLLGEKKEEALVVMLEGLSAENTNDRYWAAKSLILLDEKSEETLAVLVKDLNIEDVFYRQWAAEKLIKLGEKKEEALAALVKDFSAERDNVRHGAVERLIRLGEKKEEALAVLMKDLKVEKASVRQSAAKRLIELGEKKEEALAALVKDLSAENAYDYQEAAWILIFFGEKKEETLNILIRDLSAEEANVRQWAAERLVELGEKKEEALEILLKDLSAKYVNDRHKVAKALINLDEKKEEALAVLMKDLGSEDIYVRHIAAKTLIELSEKKEEALAVLAKDLNAKNTYHRHQAAETLIKLDEKQEEAWVILGRDLSAKEADVRRQAAQTLNRLSKKGAIIFETLAEFMKDLSAEQIQTNYFQELLAIKASYPATPPRTPIMFDSDVSPVEVQKISNDKNNEFQISAAVPVTPSNDYFPTSFFITTHPDEPSSKRRKTSDDEIATTSTSNINEFSVDEWQEQIQMNHAQASSAVPQPIVDDEMQISDDEMNDIGEDNQNTRYAM